MASIYIAGAAFLKLGWLFKCLFLVDRYRIWEKAWSDSLCKPVVISYMAIWKLQNLQEISMDLSGKRWRSSAKLLSAYFIKMIFLIL